MGHSSCGEEATAMIYRPIQFHLGGLNGISDRTLEMHFSHYEDYINEANSMT